jgi:hypothetical protein
MPGQQKDLVSRFVTPEQLESLMKLKESLKPEEIDELRSAGERLLKNVKTEKDLADLIESVSKSGVMPDIKSPRLRSALRGMASEITHKRSEASASKGNARSAATGGAASRTGSRRRRNVRKKA